MESRTAPDAAVSVPSMVIVPLGRHIEKIYETENRRLAASAWADKGENFAALDLKVNRFEDRLCPQRARESPDSSIMPVAHLP